jgi:hypothetical protein
MISAHLAVLGVYRPQIDSGTQREQWNVTGDDKLTAAHFANLVLIEAVVAGLTKPFKMAEFGQLQPAGTVYEGGHVYRSQMQVGYDEGLLSVDGETLVQRRINCVHGTGRLRFAVYLHYYDPGRPLKWEYGEVICPPIQEVPTRLMMLMPYRVL